jgi:hypothetical protein
MEVSPRALAVDDFLEAIQALQKGASKDLVSAHGVHDVEAGACVVLFHDPIIPYHTPHASTNSLLFAILTCCGIDS